MQNIYKKYRAITDVFIQLYRHKRDIDDNYFFWNNNADGFGANIKEQALQYWNVERLRVDSIISGLSQRVNNLDDFRNYANENLARVSVWENLGDINLSNKDKNLDPQKLKPR